MIIDDVKITVIAGQGGDGVVSFRREKYIPRGGPDGGNGGRGGDIYLLGVSDLAALNQFRNKKEIKADNGGKGLSKKRNGAAGEDLIVRIPIGTKIQNLKNNWQYEMTDVGQKILIAKGGGGGRGNFELRSSLNRAPREFEHGWAGQKRELRFNLQFIADIGLIGLPNAGKSTLLNLLTAAHVKTADYPFTTLEPNLGKFDNKIIADIPGLIEGASKGRGLGVKFLKHIKKTRVLVHCIDSTSDNILKDYRTVATELKNYDIKLLDKPEIILLTKSDLVSLENIKIKLSEASELKRKALPISVLDEKSFAIFKKILTSFFK